MIRKVFFDLDGVLANFHRGVYERFGRRYYYEDSSLCEYDFWECWDDIEVMREDIDKVCTKNFWEHLLWMHDGKQILSEVRSAVCPHQIYILTNPKVGGHDACAGKYAWIEREMPWVYDRVVMTTASKALLAKPDCLLIDDFDHNVDGFVEAGGQGLLVPRPWNSCKGLMESSLDIVKEALNDKVRSN